MVTFECPKNGRRFETNNVETEESGDTVTFIAKEVCPHCQKRNHTASGSIEQLEDI